MNLTPIAPNIKSDTYGFTKIGELTWRSWDGIIVDVWDVASRPDAGGTYVAPYPRLFAILQISEGGHLEFESPDVSTSVRHSRRFSMSYIPARMAVTCRAVAVQRLRHLDIHMPESALTRRFGKQIETYRLQEARLQFSDRRLSRLIELLARECLSPEPLDERYGAALVDALICALFELRPRQARPRPALSRTQLDQSLDYIEGHCFQIIRLQELANLLGLSESYFSHAFKASTGVPPLRWQMETRIGKVKELLREDRLTLTEIAAMTGFADQAHLAHSFKKVVGISPSEWRRNAPSSNA